MTSYLGAFCGPSLDDFNEVVEVDFLCARAAHLARGGVFICDMSLLPGIPFVVSVLR